MSGAPHPAPASDPFAEYRALEDRIRVDELDALLARWEFGRLLLREREEHGGKQLPHGRLREVAAAVQVGRRECQLRMQFAEQYGSEAEVRAACALLGSWTAIRDSLRATDTPSLSARAELLRALRPVAATASDRSPILALSGVRIRSAAGGDRRDRPRLLLGLAAAARSGRSRA